MSKNIKREYQKLRRELKKQALGGTESTHERIYSEATKTRRAVKTEIFGNKSKQADTSIEIWFEDFLKENNIKYIKQKAIRYLNYDFYLQDYNIACEICGCYWHGCPVCYPAGAKNEIMRKNIIKNEVKRQIAKEQNIQLIEVWGHEIEKSPNETKEKILKALNDSKNTST